MSIPMDVVEDILSRLPVKPLLQFRCVSPLWRDLIDCPNFVKLHLNRSIQTQNHLNIILCSEPRPLAAKFQPSILSLEPKELDHNPFRDEVESGIQVWGSCNGLLCLGNACNTLALWNPSTRKYVKLPNCEFEYCSDALEKDISCYYSSSGYGLGYDSVGDDYKVLGIMDIAKSNGDAAAYSVKVYSLKSNSWRKVDLFYHKLPYIQKKPGQFACGALHWTMEVKRGMLGVIVAFDLGSEEWRTVPTPSLLDINCQLSIDRFQDSLCLICDHHLGYYDIWVMREYGVESSWTQLFSIVHDSTRPAYFPKSSGEVFMQHNGGLLWFDTENSKPWYKTLRDTEQKHIKNIEVRGVNNFKRVEIYMESLVPLGGFGKMKDEKKPKEKKKNEMAGFLSRGFKLKL